MKAFNVAVHASIHVHKYFEKKSVCSMLDYICI